MRVGMEATGYSRWFERLLAELGFEVWMGDPADQGQASEEQKYDREDARLIRRLMLENNFPQIWVPSPENRSEAAAVAPASVGADAHADHESTAGVGDERGLSLEEKTIQRTRTNSLRETLVGSVGQSRRQELLELLDRMNPTIAELTEPSNGKPGSDPRCCD